MAEFTLTSQTLTNNIAVVRLAGEMDDGAFDAMEDEFGKLLESGILGVVLDFSGVDSVSSDGLGAMLNLAAVLKARSGKLAAAAAKPDIADTIALLGIGELIGLEETTDAARKAVAAVVR
ncbi:MAG: STAS domain-containing protein [Planctomycetaceae bacterium]|nr:STAS domain-containing protein [Planctomycetaceae bacterium]